jgi:hypothetical protein
MQPPIQWTPGGSFQGVKRPGLTLTTHLHPLPRLIMSGAVTPHPHTPLWGVQGKFYLSFFSFTFNMLPRTWSTLVLWCILQHCVTQLRIESRDKWRIVSIFTLNINLPAVTQENHKKWVKIAGASLESRTGHLPEKSRAVMCYSRSAEVASAAREFSNTPNLFPYQNEGRILVIWWTSHAQLNIVNNT